MSVDMNENNFLTTSRATKSDFFRKFKTPMHAFNAIPIAKKKTHNRHAVQKDNTRTIIKILNNIRHIPMS